MESSSVNSRLGVSFSDSVDSVSGYIPIGSSAIGASDCETAFISVEIGSFCCGYSVFSDVSGVNISIVEADSTGSSVEISSVSTVSIASVSSCGAISCKAVERSATSFSLR